MGIFFLTKYDPLKKPVLFVHGVSGSPRCFRALINALDKDKFQAWVAFYPSGFRLHELANYMAAQLNGLHTMYPFQHISVVAHSMGGLVSRAMINDLTKEGESSYVDKLITISTPWNGHQAAASGLRWAPAAIPVWFDVAPGSDFLSKLVATPLPSHIPHYLLFSYKGDAVFTDGNNDGVVSIASQLRPIIQNQAQEVRGYNENHTSILMAKPVINHVITLLNQEK